MRLFELLIHTNISSIIEKIMSIFQAEEIHDIWEELSNEQQQEINKAIEEVKNG